MIEKLIQLSLKNRVYILVLTVVLIVLGIKSALVLPVDAVPDITSPQVQVNVTVPALAPEEIEKLVTFPIENEMAGLPQLLELRSLSRFGLSQITMTFEDNVDIYRSRQLVSERLQGVVGTLPSGIELKLAPISTGLSEILYYAVNYKNKSELSEFDQLLSLSQIQQYIIKPLLRHTPGLAEVNTSGGYEKQLVVIPDPARLSAAGMTIDELAAHVRENTENAGGGFIELGGEQIVIRSATKVKTREDIIKIPLKFGSGINLITVGDVADVAIGSGFRSGASTDQGKEVVTGAAIMLLGENTRLVSKAVEEKIKNIQTKLPADVEIKIVYDRGDIVGKTIATVEKNLFEGALLVVVVLFAMLGNFRAAFIVALAIPLSMLFAITGMVQNKISGNLMSLGAIDFGLIIDGAVVMVENILRHLADKQHNLGRPLNREERLKEVLYSAKEVANPMFFGVLIIAVVYIPILSFAGIEGKMFHPMAYTVLFAICGALLLSLTLMPVLSSYILKGKLQERDSKLVSWFKTLYTPILDFSLRARWVIISLSVILTLSSGFIFSKMGAEFIPRLDEGTVSLQMIRSSSLGLEASLDLQKRSERILLEKFPEITNIFSKIGTAEIASDPMGANVADTFISLTDESEWRTEDGKTVSKQKLLDLMKEELEIHVPGQTLLFSQPLQLRFNEIMAGARADLALKIYGPEFNELERLTGEAVDILRKLPGDAEIEFEPLGRVPMLEITPDREAMKRINVSAQEINDAIQAAYAGEDVGNFIEESRPVPILVRLDEKKRRDPKQIKLLSIRTEDGGIIPLGKVAQVKVIESVGTIARESNQRRVAILINPKGRDVEGFVKQASLELKKTLKNPEGYYFEFGGQYENLQHAKRKLMLVVPLTLLGIFLLIYLSFQSMRQALLIFLCVPLAMTGGVFALALMGLPFSISAAVGFIALSGIAVLNGLMLISFINQLRKEGKDLRDAVIEGSLTRLRPKLMTALIASLGFLPMAMASGAGAEVQRPLAIVVIGGIITSTFLTLVLLPTLYIWIEKNKTKEEL